MKALLAAAFAAVIIGCGVAANAAGLVLDDAWSRPAVDTGVVYLTIVNRNDTPDALIAAQTPVAHTAELHETVAGSAPMQGMSGMSGMSGMGSMSTASMKRVKQIPVPARGRTQLAPGEYHIMLIGLRSPLKAGTAFPLRLDFRHAGWTTVQVHVHAMG